MKNIEIGRRGELCHNSYVKLIDAVCSRHDTAQKLEKQLQNIPSISKELDDIGNNIGMLILFLFCFVQGY